MIYLSGSYRILRHGEDHHDLGVQRMIHGDDIVRRLFGRSRGVPVCTSSIIEER